MKACRRAGPGPALGSGVGTRRAACCAAAGALQLAAQRACRTAAQRASSSWAAAAAATHSAAPQPAPCRSPGSAAQVQGAARRRPSAESTPDAEGEHWGRGGREGSQARGVTARTLSPRSAGRARAAPARRAVPAALQDPGRSLPRASHSRTCAAMMCAYMLPGLRSTRRWQSSSPSLAASRAACLSPPVPSRWAINTMLRAVHRSTSAVRCSSPTERSGCTAISSVATSSARGVEASPAAAPAAAPADTAELPALAGGVAGTQPCACMRAWAARRLGGGQMLSIVPHSRRRPAAFSEGLPASSSAPTVSASMACSAALAPGPACACKQAQQGWG